MWTNVTSALGRCVIRAYIKMHRGFNYGGGGSSIIVLYKQHTVDLFSSMLIKMYVCNFL